MAGKTKSARKLTEAQQLVEAFLFTVDGCKWSLEIKIANQIIKEHGFEFLISLKGRTKVPSMCWFIGEKGKRFLLEAKTYQTLNFQGNSIPLENDPVAPKTEIHKKPTSFREFLNLFNNK